MNTEKQLFNYVKRACKMREIGCFKMHSESTNGWPDLLLAYDGWTFYVELKTPAGTGRLSPVQKLTIEKMRKLGLEVFVIKSKEEADAIIKDLIGR